MVLLAAGETRKADQVAILQLDRGDEEGTGATGYDLMGRKGTNGQSPATETFAGGGGEDVRR
jgi:hypothetical protein